MHRDVSKDATCERDEERKTRTETFMRQTGYFAQITQVYIAPEILHAGYQPEGSYILQVSSKSVERSQSYGGKVENRHLPLTWHMAYTTSCTTILAVMGHLRADITT